MQSRPSDSDIIKQALGLIKSGDLQWETNMKLTSKIFRTMISSDKRRELVDAFKEHAKSLGMEDYTFVSHIIDWLDDPAQCERTLRNLKSTPGFERSKFIDEFVEEMQTMPEYAAFEAKRQEEIRARGPLMEFPPQFINYKP